MIPDVRIRVRWLMTWLAQFHQSTKHQYLETYEKLPRLTQQHVGLHRLTVSQHPLGSYRHCV